MTLTEAEIVAYTKRERPAWQARVLRALGVPFAVHPFDGNLLVDREAARAILGALPGHQPEAPPEVNVIAMRERRAASKARLRR